MTSNKWTLVFFQNGAAGIGGPARIFNLEATDYNDARAQARELFRGDNFEPGVTPAAHHNQDTYLVNMLLVSELHESSGDLLKQLQQEVELEEDAFATDSFPDPMLAVCQPWVIRERGSAPEWDRHSLHVDEDERDRHEKEYIKKNHSPGRAPSCYTQPEGDAYLVAVDKLTYLKLQRQKSVMVYRPSPKPFELRMPA